VTLTASLRLLVRLLAPLARHPALLAAVLALSALAVLSGLATPWFVRRAVDMLVDQGATTEVYLAAGAIVLFALIQAGTDWARLAVMARLGQQAVLDLRVRTFRHLTRLPFAFFDRVHTGDLIARLGADVDALSMFYARSAVLVSGNLVFLAAVLAVMFTWDRQLTLVYVALLPFLFHAMTLFARVIGPAQREVRETLGDVTTRLRDALTGLDTVQGLGLDDAVSADVTAAADALAADRIAAGRAVARWRDYPNFLNDLGSALVLVLGARRVLDGTLSLGTLVGFTTCFGLLGRPVRQTGFLTGVITQALAAAERIFEILDVHADVVEAADAVPPPDGPGLVRFEHVGFAYAGGDLDALADVHVELRPGELVALVGPSGAGKTTLAHLVPRFYDPTSGAITLDGRPLTTLTLAGLRRRVGIAFQNSFLFDGTVRQNVAWGKADATDPEIRAALDQAGLADEIPDLDAVVGERGLRLSGGQRQRVALARVLLYDPQILVLDEPTASLDPATEAGLRRAVANVRQGRTTVVIAHRLWTVAQADHIVVLERGRVVQEARSTAEASAHERLLHDESGLYAALVAAQAAPTKEATCDRAS